MSVDVTLLSGKHHGELSVTSDLYAGSPTGTWACLRLRRDSGGINLHFDDHAELDAIADECRKLADELEAQQRADLVADKPLVQVNELAEALTP